MMLTAAPPRGVTRFALVSLMDGDGDAAVSGAVDLDEISRAGRPEDIPGVLLGPMKPAKLAAREIVTGSLPERPADMRRARVLSESLRLSISGRF